MLSACLHMTKNYRRDMLKYLGLGPVDQLQGEISQPTIWLRSAKLPFDGEGLADKGFENGDKYFDHFNRVRCPRMLRNRNVKQCDVVELLSKEDYCKLRYTSEVDFTLFEHVDAVKDCVPIENISQLPHAVEWAHGHANLQQPLRKPGYKSGLPADYWK